jgi:hypothetical protein
MARHVKVAETKDVQPGTGQVLEADGHRFALFDVAGRRQCRRMRFARNAEEVP